MPKINQIEVNLQTYDIEPKNSELLASNHIIDTLGYTPESILNKVSSWQTTTDYTHYPAEKLVKDECDNIRAVAEGKCKTYILNYTTDVAPEEYGSYYKFDGTQFTSQAELEAYISGLAWGNPNFNSNADYIMLDPDFEYYVFERPVGYTIAKGNDFHSFKMGDEVFVTQINVPDRWWGTTANTMYALETKTDLSNYVTIGTAQTITGLKTIKSNPLQFTSSSDAVIGKIEYNPNDLSFDITANNTDLYLGTNGTGKNIFFTNGAASSTAPRYAMRANFFSPLSNSLDLGSSSESWKDLYLSGANIYNNGTGYKFKTELTADGLGYVIKFSTDGGTTWYNAYSTFGGSNYFDGTVYTRHLLPNSSTNDYNLGSSTNKWNTLHLSGNLTDGTNSISIANIANKSQIPTHFSQLNGRTTNLLSEPGTQYGTTPTEAPLVHEQTGNRFFGIPANRIVVEDSLDGGTTWTVRAVSDWTKQSLFDSGIVGNFNIAMNSQGKRSCQCITRVTCALANFGTTADQAPDSQKIALWNQDNYVGRTIYSNCEKLYYWVGGPDYADITCQTAPAPSAGSEPSFTTRSLLNLARGWNGGNTSSVSSFTLGGNKNQAPIVRFIFRVNCSDGSYDDSKLNQSYLTSNFNILSIRGFSSSIWGSTHPMQVWNRPYEAASGDYGTTIWYESLIPNSTWSYRNLGISGNKWYDVWTSHAVHIDDFKFEKNNGNLEFYATDSGVESLAGYVMASGYLRTKGIFPTANNTYDLGHANYKWHDAYFGGTIYTNTIDTPSGTTDMLIGNSSGVVNCYSTFRPYSNNSRDLGSSGLAWKDFYLGSNMYLNGTNCYISSLADGQISYYHCGAGHVYFGGLRPEYTNTWDLGSTANKWKDLYLSGNIDAAIATMTDNLYIKKSVSTFKTGITYHCHIPAGTNVASLCDWSFLQFDQVSNIVTPITPISVSTTNVNGFGFYDWDTEPWPIGLTVSETGGTVLAYRLATSDTSTSTADIDFDFTLTSSIPYFNDSFKACCNGNYEVLTNKIDVAEKPVVLYSIGGSANFVANDWSGDTIATLQTWNKTNTISVKCYKKGFYNLKVQMSNTEFTNFAYGNLSFYCNAESSSGEIISSCVISGFDSSLTGSIYGAAGPESCYIPG